MAIEMNGLYIPGDASGGCKSALLCSVAPTSSGFVTSAVFGAHDTHSSLGYNAQKYTGLEPLRGGDVGVLSDVLAWVIYDRGGSLVIIEGDINNTLGPISRAEKMDVAKDIIGIAHCLVLGCFGFQDLGQATTDARITAWDQLVDIDLDYDIEWPRALTGTMWHTTRHNVRDSWAQKEPF